MSGPTTGYLLIADITGYTGFLSKTELEHAQGILTELLQVLLKETKPPLALSRLAGDAVVSYALGDAFASGQTFIEMIENTYVAFRRNIDLMVMNTQCRCNACQRIVDLDLKFFVHYGTFALQKLADHDELVGSDVNLLFRLTKNGVVESTGIKAYALYTQAVIDRLGLDGLTTDALTPHRESYEHMGEVTVWVADMSSVWKTKQFAVQEPTGELLLQASIDIDVPPPILWSSLTNPDHLQKLLGATRVGRSALASGRLASGAELHCHHGEGKQTLLTIVDWSPFDRMLTRFAIPLPPIGTAFGKCEYLLAPTERGTLLTQRMTKPTGPWLARNLATAALRRMDKSAMKDLLAFKAFVEGHASTRIPIEQAAIPTAEQLREAVRSSLVSNPA